MLMRMSMTTSAIMMIHYEFIDSAPAHIFRLASGQRCVSRTPCDRSNASRVPMLARADPLFLCFVPCLPQTVCEHAKCARFQSNRPTPASCRALSRRKRERGRERERNFRALTRLAVAGRVLLRPTSAGRRNWQRGAVPEASDSIQARCWLTCPPGRIRLNSG